MLTLSPATEELIRAKAAQTGRTPDEVVRDALLPGGTRVPWRRPVPEPKMTSREEFFARLDEIVARSAARPVVDPRSDDEIIGYDDFGLPR